MPSLSHPFVNRTFIIRSLSTLTLVMAAVPLGGNERRVPTVDDLVTLKSVGSVQIFPDGGRVAFTVTETDF